jgi:hypothetical protein
VPLVHKMSALQVHECTASVYIDTQQVTGYLESGVLQHMEVLCCSDACCACVEVNAPWPAAQCVNKMCACAPCASQLLRAFIAHAHIHAYCAREVEMLQGHTAGKPLAYYK